MDINNIKIEKGIPIPARQKKGLGVIAARMEVGDSFEVSARDANNVRSSISYYAAKLNREFTVQKYGNAYRCWRTR